MKLLFTSPEGENRSQKKLRHLGSYLLVSYRLVLSCLIKSNYNSDATFGEIAPPFFEYQRIFSTSRFISHGIQSYLSVIPQILKMNIPINYAVVEQKIMSFRSFNVILDFDVASLYGVETKHVNQAVRNNPDKFPEGYVLTLSEEEWNDLRSKILTANHSKLRFLPKAFTEKGLYMLATILKSKKATATTIAIVETFTNLRLLSGAISELSNEPDAKKKKSLLNQTGNLMNDLFGDELQTKDTETTFEFNFAVLKLKHTIKRK